MTRLIALLASTILLTSCSSDTEVLYKDIDGMVVIETETWTSKQDSPQFTWAEVALSDVAPTGVTSLEETRAAQLQFRQAANSDDANSTTGPVATASYQIEFSDSNTYYLWVRARVLNEQTDAIDDSAVLTLTITADAEIDSWQIAGFTDQWQWIAVDASQNVLSATVTNQNIHQLDITTDTTSLLLDKIIFTDQPGYLPTESGPSATIDDTDTDTDTDNEVDPADPADTNDTAVIVDDTTDQTGNDDSTDDQNTDADNAGSTPVVSIDGSTRVEAGQALQLTASFNNVSPAESVYYYWDFIQASGEVSFDDITRQAPMITFDLPGVYTIQVTASDASGHASATIDITVTAASNDQSGDTTDNSGNDNTDESDGSSADQNITAAHRWLASSSHGSAAKRHETSGVAVNGKMYVIGGRGHQPIDVYDSATNTWSQAAKPPIEMHHFQAVAIDHIIYVVGAATCCYPVEINIPNIYQFDTQTGQWSKGAAIPGNRLRGSTAAAVYNRKIYIVGGNTRGHSGGAVSWFDEFDPATGQWNALADAPDARDHATIAVVGDQLVVAGGRRSDFPNTFGNTVGRTNVFDFSQQRWQTAADIPTQRAGTMAVGLGSELIVIGGESLSSSNAHNAVEAFDTLSGSWRSLSPLPTPRHGGAAAVINQSIHVVAGSMQRGGAPETDAHEILK